MLLIELESAYGDKFLCGKKLEEREITEAMDLFLENGEEESFLSKFCARFGYEEVQREGSCRVDYIIDLDTHLLIKPGYGQRYPKFSLARFRFP